MKTRRVLRALLWTAFIVYDLVLLSILFLGGRGHRFPYDSIWDYMRYSVQLIPFKTVWGYVTDFLNHGHWVLGLAIKNVFGNLVLFLPMGMFLPCLFRRVRKPGTAALVALCTILGVELFQLVLRRGIFDIDDLILNMAGFLGGFFIIRIPLIRKLCVKLHFWTEEAA